MEYPIAVALKRPVNADGEVVERLEFDEPDLGTSIAVEEAKSSGEQTILLLAGMAGVDRSVIVKIKESDFAEIKRRVLLPYQAHIRSQRQEADEGNGDQGA